MVHAWRAAACTGWLVCAHAYNACMNPMHAQQIENVDVVAETLEELWLSYNSIEKLVRPPAEGWTDPIPLVPHLLALHTERKTAPPTAQRTIKTHNNNQSGTEKLANLRVLFLSNNKIRDFGELDRLAGLEKLEDLLLVRLRAPAPAGRSVLV